MASFKIAAFTCNTAVARQNIVPSGGPGTNPKAAIFVVSGATALDTVTAHARVSIGMTDGTTQLCNALMSEDALTVSTADTGNRFDSAQVITTCLTTSEAVDSAANFVAWTNDGVAINWSNFPATALRGHVIFFYGSDLSADVVSFTPSATSNTEVLQTGLSFAPDALVGLSSWNAYSAGGSGGGARLSIGFASSYGGSIQQACRTHIDADRAVGTANIHRTNRFLSRISVTAEVANYEVTSFTSDGFGITTRAGSLGSPCAILALKVTGARARVVSAIVDTDAAGQKYIESFMFKPKASFFLGGDATASNTLSTTGDGGAFLGFAVDASEEFSTSWLDEEISTATSNADTYSLTTSSASARYPNITGATRYTAVLTGFVHNGINLEVTTTSTDDHIMSFLAFEDANATIGADTERLSDDFRLLVTIDRLTSGDVEQIADAFAFYTTDRKAFGDTEPITDSFVFKATGGDQTLTSSDTEQVADAFAFYTTDRKAFSDEERLADAFVFQTTDRKAFGDTEEISDAFRLVVTSDARALSDEERISDAFAFHTTDRKAFGDTVQIADATLFVVTSDRKISDDTEQITEAFNFVVGKFLVADETVQIGDGFVLVSMGTTILISNDTEEISDGFVTVLAGMSNLTFVADETVQLSDGVVMIRGQVLVSGDEVAISDAFNSGRGLIARKAIKRGRVF